MATMTAILDFGLEQFYLFLIYKSPRCFMSTGLSVQEKKQKIDFQDGSHLGFPIWLILDIFDIQAPWWFLQKIDFLDGHNEGHLWFWLRTILAIFDLQVTLMLHTKFQGNWPFGSEEVKNRFSRRLPQLPSWISIRNNFSYFWSILQVTTMLPTKFQVSWIFSSGEEAKNRFSWWPP